MVKKAELNRLVVKLEAHIKKAQAILDFVKVLQDIREAEGGKK